MEDQPSDASRCFDAVAKAALLMDLANEVLFNVLDVEHLEPEALQYLCDARDAVLLSIDNLNFAVRPVYSACYAELQDRLVAW